MNSKLILAEEFADLGGVMAIYEGPNGSTLVTERNKKALDVLRAQLAAGKKRLAIFYGAGHMSDMASVWPVILYAAQRVEWLRPGILRQRRLPRPRHAVIPGRLVKIESSGADVAVARVDLSAQPPIYGSCIVVIRVFRGAAGRTAVYTNRWFPQYLWLDGDWVRGNPMLRLSMSELTTYRWSFEEDVTNYKAAGIHHIGVWQQKVADCGLDEAQRLLFDYGMSVSSLMWAGGFTGSDGRPHRDAVHDGLESIDAGRRIAGRLPDRLHRRARRPHALARTSIGPHRTRRNGLVCGSAWCDSGDRTHACRLWFELDVSHHTGCLTRVPRPTAFAIRQVGSRHLSSRAGCGCTRLTYRRWYRAWGWSNWATPADRRVASPDRCLLGRGTVPIHELLLALIENGYAGCCEVELMGEEIEEHDYWHLLEDSRRVLEDYVGASIGQ